MESSKAACTRDAGIDANIAPRRGQDPLERGDEGGRTWGTSFT